MGIQSCDAKRWPRTLRRVMPTAWLACAPETSPRTTPGNAIASLLVGVRVGVGLGEPLFFRTEIGARKRGIAGATLVLGDRGVGDAGDDDLSCAALGAPGVGGEAFYHWDCTVPR